MSIDAAILGFYGAIKISIREGHNPRDVFGLVLKEFTLKYRCKPTIVEANQFHHGATGPIGTRTREDGSSYVVTIHGDEINVVPGDWIILENPPGDGTRAYPCKDEVFREKYEPVT